MKKLVLLMLMSLLLYAGFDATIKSKGANENVDELLVTAKSYEQQGYYLDAIRVYEKALKIKKNDTNILRKMALDYYAMGDEKDFVDTAEKVLSLTGGDRDMYISLGYLYLEKGDYKKALSYIIEGKEKFPYNDELATMYYSYRFAYHDGYELYDYITNFKDGYAVVTTIDGDQRIIDEKGKVMNNKTNFSCITDFYEDENGDMLVAAKVDDKLGYYDFNGYKRFSPTEDYYYLGGMYDGYALVNKDGKWGYIDHNFKECHIEFEDATAFTNGIAAVKKDGKWTLINTEFVELNSYIYEDVLKDEFMRCATTGKVLVKLDGKYVLVDTEGNVLSAEYEVAKPYLANKGGAAVKRADGWTLIDVDGNEITEVTDEELSSYVMDVAPFCSNELYGFMDDEGYLFMPEQFDYLRPMNESGYAAVRVGSAWHLINLYIYEEDESIF